MPADGAVDVPVSSRIGLRVSRPINPETVNARTMTLIGDQGHVAAAVVAAERGRLVFVTPREHLREGGTYHLVIDGIVDVAGEPMPASQISFVTARPADKGADAPEAADAEAWLPDDMSRKNGWRADRGQSPWETLPPLLAPPGVTAISGRVLTLDGRPLAGVTLAAAGIGETESDRSGRFLLLAPAATGRQVLDIVGASASRAGRRYGFFEYGLDLDAGKTNVLPFTIWMPKLDTRHIVRIPSPTTSEVVVTTRYIPGLELHIPPNTVIRGEDGKPVTELGITPIPVDRPPFPLAKNVVVPVYFTIQPGGGYVHTAGAGPRGAWLVYPNYRREYAGKRLQFYHYDPEVKDWHVYGLGTVTRNEAQVVPDPSTRIYEITGAMIGSGDNPNPEEPDDECCDDGDPVNLATGIFTLQENDLYLADVIPIGLQRTYLSRDLEVRPFGVGMTHPYAMFLWSAQQYVEADLILPDGRHVHYVRTSPGVGYTDAIFTHQETPTTSATPGAFYKSVMAWNGRGWDIRLKDGTVYVFGENAPLQAIRDRFGNTVTITRANGDQFGNVAQVTSPHGRWIAFTYDTSNRITQAKDHIGRTVTYTYDASGNLATVTDPENRVTSYTYDTSHRMLTVKPPSLQGTSSNLVTNEYTTAADAPTPVGWVKKQTFVDGGAYQFAYTVSNGTSTQTDVTDPRAFVRRLSFNSDGYTLSDTRAHGQPLQLVTTSSRQAGSHFITTTTTTSGKQTALTYDANGNVLTATRLAGTPQAATTTYTYHPVFNEVTSVTDPLNHTTTIAYDDRGRPMSITDPLNHTKTFGYNAANQLTSVTDALQHLTQYAYSGGDLVSTTDPLGRVTSRLVDSVGRTIRQTDAAGQVTRFAYNKLNDLTEAVDTHGGITTYSYDPSGRLTGVTDAKNHTTSYTYNGFDQVLTRTDPLTKTESYAYDLQGNRVQTTDRKGQVRSATWDDLERLSTLTYADASTVTYGYDSGNRLTSITDSASGVITRVFDGLGRLESETTPQGSVSYTYDAANRRTGMTVAGQSAVTYGYDDANRLTSVTQAASTVTLTYDEADRRSSLTLANGVVVDNGYDAASQLTSLTYTLGAATLGTLTYAYDLAGQCTEVGGTWARTGLPQMLVSASYDAANRLIAWGGTQFSYDANGSLLSDGLTSYAWNPRNELSGMSGESSATFAYDGVRRRHQKTVAGSSKTFLFDGDSIVQELTSGTPSSNLLTSLDIDELWTRTDAGGARTILGDALGSTIAEVDQTGVVKSQFTYGLFGKTEISGAASENSFQFTGRERDSAASDVYFYRARYYDPELGRFLSEDPLGFAAGPNFYTYVGNSPTNLIDPFGLQEGSRENLAARQRVADIADSYKGSTDYEYAKRKGKWPANTNKCNAFVCDVTDQAGAPARFTPRGARPRCPLAGDFADRYTKIPNWRPLGPNESLMPGDIVVYKIPL